MKILVIGGMHGNEPLGIELVSMFKTNPVDSVDAIIGNENALSQNCRYIKTDLNRSFPGSKKSKAYETRRAAELMELGKRYDLVIDFHNTYCPKNDCSFVGDAAQPILEEVSARLGLLRMIVADYDCINKYLPNCISVEVSMDSSVNNPRYWYETITRLANDTLPKSQKIPTRYKFVYRMTLKDRDRLELLGQNLQAFRPLSPQLVEALTLKSPAYPIFIADKFTPYNYGGILNKID